VIILTELTIDGDLVYHALIVNNRVVLSQGPSDEGGYETVVSSARELARALGLKIRRIDLSEQDLRNLSGSLTWRDKRPWDWQDVANTLTHLASRTLQPDSHPEAAEEFRKSLDAFENAAGRSDDPGAAEIWKRACLALFKKQAVDAELVLNAERARRAADQPLIQLVRDIGLSGLATLQAALHAYHEEGLGEPINRSEVVHALACGAPDDRVLSLSQVGLRQLSAHLIRLRSVAIENGLRPEFRMAPQMRLPQVEEDVGEIDSPAHH
jgi:hypothetical protein